MNNPLDCTEQNLKLRWESQLLRFLYNQTFLQCEHDHVIEELDGLHESIKPLIDKTEMIGKHMRDYKGPKDKREWELEPSYEDFYYVDKRALRKFLGAKGKKSYHQVSILKIDNYFYTFF